MSFGHVYCSVDCIGCSIAHISCGHKHGSEAPNRCQAPLEALGLFAHVFVPINVTYVCSHLTSCVVVVSSMHVSVNILTLNGIQNTTPTDAPFSRVYVRLGEHLQ